MDLLLFNFLKELDRDSQVVRTIVAIGGTALNIFGTKEETKDVDIGVFTKDVDVIDFARAYSRKNKVRVDVFVDGWFQPMYFPDMFARAIQVESQFQNIQLYVMNHYDLILTKIDRWVDKDIRDISALLKKVECSRVEMDERYQFCLNHYNEPSRMENFKIQYQKFINLFSRFLH